MKTYTKGELNEIIRLHRMWLQGEDEGKRADLSMANLSRADLSDADLSRADLSDAVLSRAVLSMANLSRANLSRADLSMANLSMANLSFAVLSDADLSRADLSDAVLSMANLSRADLSRANLSFAVLSDNIIQAGPIGSRKDYVVYNATLDELGAGCWTGTLDEFEERVSSFYGDSLHGLEYAAFIEYAKKLKSIRGKT